MANKICRKCRTVNSGENTFCVRCGSKLSDENSSTKVTAAALSAAAVIIFCSFGYLFISRTDFRLPGGLQSAASSGGGGGAWPVSPANRTPEPAVRVTAIPTVPVTAPPEYEGNSPMRREAENPEPSAEPDISGTERASEPAIIITDNMLVDFMDAKYNFKCSYPADFLEYDDYDNTLYTVKSEDGSATEIINAEPIGGRHISQLYDEYISGHNGTVDMHFLDDNRFALSIHDNGRDYYKYCEIKNGNVYWFEFISPIEQERIYSAYIQKIKDLFIIY